MKYADFVEWLDNLDVATIDSNPISFGLTDFEKEEDFAKSMFLAGQCFLSEDEIVVRYSKPYTEDKSDIIVRFQILRSKAKIFSRYMAESGKSFIFTVNTANNIKSCVKLFNSLGVKGMEGESMLSKEVDYTRDMKDSLIKGENKICVEVSFKTYEWETPRLDWWTIEADDPTKDYLVVKETINEIFNK